MFLWLLVLNLFFSEMKILFQNEEKLSFECKW